MAPSIKTTSIFASCLWIAATASAPAYARSPQDGLLDHDVRVSEVRSACETLKANYAFWFLKEERIGISGEALCRKAVEREESTVDPDERSNEIISTANLEFYERMTALAGAFQDAHLSISPSELPGNFVLPFVVHEAVENEKKIFLVTAVSKKLLRLTGHDTQAIKIGDRLLSIDGNSVESEIERLTPFQNSSSSGEARADALSALGRRVFPFPRTPNTRLQFERKSADGHLEELRPLVLQWVIEEPKSGGVQQADQAGLATALGFQTVHDKVKFAGRTDLPQSFDPKVSPQPTEKNLKISHFVDSENDQSVSLGHIRIGTRLYGYLGLRQFTDKAELLTLVEQPKSKYRTIPLIKGFLKKIDIQKLPLIIDLRGNPGGDSTLVEPLFALLLPSGSPFPFYGISQGVRSTYFASNLFRNDESNHSLTLSDKLMLDGLRSAPPGSLYSQAAISGLLKASLQVSPKKLGFSGKIIALIDSQCVSSCDLFAGLLSINKRALQIIGQPTAGTGGGKISLGSLSTEDILTNHTTLRLSITNFLFGQSPNLDHTSSQVVPVPISEYCTENQPVRPSIPYFPTVRDWLENDVDLFNRVAKEFK